MNGGQLFVQPSNLGFNAVVSGQTVQGIPAPYGGGIVGVLGNCQNLLADSPPVLGQEFAIASYSLPVFAIYYNTGGFANAPDITVAMSLLVNGDPWLSDETDLSLTEATPDAYVGNGIIAGNLFNPINVGARDRLGLQLTLTATGAPATSGQVGVGLQYNPANQTYMGARSTLGYSIVELAPRRRL